MSVQQEHATSETATLTTTESGGVYQSLFDKINLTPVSSIQEIDLWQNSETLADASPDERVTAAIHVLLSYLAKSGENVVKLDKSLLDFHIDDLDQKISKQLDAVMHHPEFQKVDPRLREEADFYLSVRSSLPAHQVLHQLPLVCKIGAPDDVTLLINVALNGVPLVPLTSVPAALPLRLENQYFALDMHSDAAKSMLESGCCMIYAPGTMGDLKPELFAVLRT
ncbi:type VI secretion system baseplate subunit TssK [Escherichia coli]|nr:type VI secretion system baseplate subunit TssK [Escherichia coli]